MELPATTAWGSIAWIALRVMRAVSATLAQSASFLTAAPVQNFFAVGGDRGSAIPYLFLTFKHDWMIPLQYVDAEESI
jgi:hypothetical protein